MAIFADYLYQLFVFVPVLVLVARREEEKINNGNVEKQKIPSTHEIERRKRVHEKVGF